MPPLRHGRIAGNPLLRRCRRFNQQRCRSRVTVASPSRHCGPDAEAADAWDQSLAPTLTALLAHTLSLLAVKSPLRCHRVIVEPSLRPLLLPRSHCHRIAVTPLRSHCCCVATASPSHCRLAAIAVTLQASRSRRCSDVAPTIATVAVALPLWLHRHCGCIAVATILALPSRRLGRGAEALMFGVGRSPGSNCHGRVTVASPSRRRNPDAEAADAWGQSPAPTLTALSAHALSLLAIESPSRRCCAIVEPLL